MKQFLPLVLAIVLAQNISFACNSIAVKPEGVQLQYFTVLADTFSYQYFKADIVAGRPYKLLLNHTSADTLMVYFYSTEPCQGGAQPTSSQLLNGLHEFNVDNDKKFFKISSLRHENVPFSITLIAQESSSYCDRDVNEKNRLEQTKDLGNLQVGANCYQTCNIGCWSWNLDKGSDHLFVPRPVKWLEYHCNSIQMVNLSLSSGSINKPSAIIYGKKDGQLFYYCSKDIKPNTLDLIDITRFSSIVIGIYDRDGKEGNFDLCLQAYPHKETCTDFLRESGDTLMLDSAFAIGTPTIFEGDTVHFVYKLMDWIPIGQNWLHGISVTVGPGWKSILLDTTLTTPRAQVAFNGRVLDSMNLAKVLYTEQDTFSLSNTSLHDLIVPGWYIDLSERGPGGPDVKHKWGIKFEKMQSSIDTPLFTLRFSLIAAKSDTGCTGNKDSYVNIRPTSDYITGNYWFPGCTNLNPARKEITINCCVPPSILALKDTIVCEGQDFQMKGLLTRGSTFRIIKNETSRALQQNLCNFDQPISCYNNAQTEQHIGVRAYWNRSSSQCPDSSEFEITVRPKLAALSLVKDSVCMDQPTNVRGLFDQLLAKNPADQLTLVTSKDNSAWNQVQSRGSHTEFSAQVKDKHGCKTVAKIQLNGIECSNATATDTTQGVFDFTISPNPAIQNVQLRLQNQVEAGAYNLKIYDGQGKVFLAQRINIAFGSSLLDYDLAKLSSGSYYVSLSNEKTFIRRSLILLHD